MSIQVLPEYVKLRRNLSLEPYELRKLQWTKLKSLLKHSYETVPFYHRRFVESKIRPSDIRTFEDLSKIPITTKAELQKTPMEYLIAGNADLKKCTKTRTTGSTGMPLNLLIDNRAVEYGESLWRRTYIRNGLRLWDKMVIIRDLTVFPKKSRLLDLRLRLMRRKYVSATEDAERLIGVLEHCRPDVIKGYSSTLREMARVLKGRERRIRPRLIFTGASILTKWARSLIGSSFGVDPLDNYGTNEFGLIAWECSKHSGYHVNIDSLVAEFLDGNEEVAAGERGEIVCTGLNNYAMPLIRYRLHDVVVPSDEECSCGVKFPLLKSIDGRLNDFLVALDGRRITPSIFYPYPFDDYVGIEQFKVTQDRKDRLIVQMVVDKNKFDNKRVDKARLKIKKVFGEDMQVDFDIVDEIKLDMSGKMRPISRLF